jgi:hypothetical protein
VRACAIKKGHRRSADEIKEKKSRKYMVVRVFRNSRQAHAPHLPGHGDESTEMRRLLPFIAANAGPHAWKPYLFATFLVHVFFGKKDAVQSQTTLLFRLGSLSFASPFARALCLVPKGKKKNTPLVASTRFLLPFLYACVFVRALFFLLVRR